MRILIASVLLSSTALAGPCDIYGAAGVPCVGAFSLLRALTSTYAGPLYNVRRASDNTTRAVPLLAPGGYANTTAQDDFCAGTACEVWRIYDQSAFSNDLAPAPPGGSARHVDNGVNASALPVRLPNGARGYGALFVKGLNQGYRIDITNGVAVGNEAETIYMVTSGGELRGRDGGRAPAQLMSMIRAHAGVKLGPLPWALTPSIVVGCA
jgi:hypothetical protein